jgi:hypothetical protein
MLRYTYIAGRVKLSSHLSRGLAGGLFTSGPPPTKVLYTHLRSSMRAPPL